MHKVVIEAYIRTLTAEGKVVFSGMRAWLGKFIEAGTNQQAGMFRHMDPFLHGLTTDGVKI